MSGTHTFSYTVSHVENCKSLFYSMLRAHGDDLKSSVRRIHRVSISRRANRYSGRLGEPCSLATLKWALGLLLETPLSTQQAVEYSSIAAYNPYSAAAKSTAYISSIASEQKINVGAALS